MSGYDVIGHTSSYVYNVHAYKPGFCCTHQSHSQSHVYVSSSLRDYILLSSYWISGSVTGESCLVCDYTTPVKNAICVRAHALWFEHKAY